MASTYLTRNTGGSGTSGTIATLSLWVKVSDVTNQICVFSASSNSTGSPFCLISRENTGEFRFSDYTNNTTPRAEKITSALGRDVNGWYHIVVAIDTNQATASDRIKFYINGVLQTSFSTDTNYSLGATTSLGQNNEMVIGRYEPYNAGYWNGLVSHFHYTDGTAYDASAFGEFDATTGIWKPITEPSVTYGTNGFFLKFENSGSMGLDSSGNANNFTVNGSLTQTVDTPSNVFCTMNPLDNYYQQATFTNGNTTVATATVPYCANTSTLGVSKGKWYFEWKNVSMGSAKQHGVGMVGLQTTSASQGFPGLTANAFGYNLANGNSAVNSSESSYGTASNVNDIYGMAVDLDNNKFWVSRNGTWINSGDPANGTNGITGITSATSTPLGAYFVAYGDQNDAEGGYSVSFNFGNGYFGTTAVASGNADDAGLGVFEYAPPTGYYALCTKNINTYG